ERLDGDEIPFLRRHVIDRSALLDSVKLTVEPGHLDVEELAPVLGGGLALRAPGGLKAGIGEGSLQGLLRTTGRDARGHRLPEAKDAQCGDRPTHRRHGEKIAPTSVQRVRHHFLLSRPVERRFPQSLTATISYSKARRQSRRGSLLVARRGDFDRWGRAR